MRIIIISLLLSGSIFSQVSFNDYFLDKTLRLDYFHTGNNEEDFYSFDELIEEPYWGGSKVNLIDRFNYGKYSFSVIDIESEKLIYSRTYTTLFEEWQTTAEAKKTMKTFSETLVFPYPKKTVRVEFYGRDKKNKLFKKFEYTVDPSNYFITPERSEKFNSFEVLKSGDPALKVDIVMIPDGYTEEEMDKFKKDCNRFAGYLFNSSPFRENKDKFNIWGVYASSEQSGTDIPAEDIWKETVVDATFYTFDLERYVMTAANKKLRDIASYAPYDQIVIIVNSDKYGGGAIYNHYSCFVSDNDKSELIFIHEFGHGFVSLGDEYFTSDVAYEEFYPLDVEPLDANLTTLIDFESKWKDLVEEGIPIPTPSTEEYENIVGAFEGGGYMPKGIYRPKQDCVMKSFKAGNFCPVCKRAIQQMIDFYTE
ncbi:MAG: M64 family metallopeptidase [Ignavibacteria bacterium]|jgi:hypothetical protein